MFDFTGPPSFVTDLELADFTTDSVMLTFAAPANSPCVANYTITTNAVGLSSTTNTSVSISRPASDPEGAIYSVSVSAVDLSGRMGNSSSVNCFMFSSERDAKVSHLTIIDSYSFIQKWWFYIQEWQK